MRARILTVLVLLVALVAVGCGSAWTQVPLGTLDETTDSLGGEYARLVLDDERVIEMRVVTVTYPFVEGHRVLGEWSTPRRVRVDLRSVTKVEVRPAS